MVLDYCERRPVSKNRPKKQQIGLLVFILAGAVLVSFGTGFIAGWFFCNQSLRISNNKKEAAVDAAKSESAATLQSPQGQPVPKEVPLTFYQTLPNGAKTVIGSGLNPGKGDGEVNKTPVVDQQVPAGQLPLMVPAPKAPAVNPVKQAEIAPAPADSSTIKKSSADGTFCVQVASLRDKKDADAVKSRLLAKGLAAYIVESAVEEKGTWYRVRLGKRLTHSEAAELATKAGKGAIVAPE